MSNLLIELSNRYFYRYPYVEKDVAQIIHEIGLGLEVDFESGNAEEKIYSTDVSSISRSCCLILLLIAFVENNKNLRRKLLNYLRNFMQKSKIIQPNISEYTQFVLDSFNNLVNFVVENMIEDINTDFYTSNSDLPKRENQLLIEKYTCSVQFILNDVFEILVSSAGLNKEILRSNCVLPILFEGIYNLDLVFKKIIIYLLQSPDFAYKITSFINSANMENTIDHYFQIDQQILLSITSILNRISSIVIYCSNSFSSLIKYTKVLFNAVLGENKDGKITKNVINCVFYRIMYSNSLDQFNKDLITSIGLFLSSLYISEQATFDNDKNDLYLKSMDRISKNVEEHVKRCKFSGVCKVAFYRGLVLCCSMIHDAAQFKNPTNNYEIFELLFHSIACLITDYKSDEDSAYGLQSLVIWISRFKYEISSLDKTSINLSTPYFYLTPISDIIFSFLDQPINYHSKLANQILEEFVDYLLVLDSIFEQDIVEEINSDPLNWFVDILLNNSFKNNKNKFLSLNILFNGILNHSRNHKFKNQFFKLNRFINLRIDQLDLTQLDHSFIEIQLIYYLVYSLSIHNIASSSQNLILTWFNLRKKVFLKEEITKELEENLFLDFILFTSIQIIKRDDYKSEKKEIISTEGKSEIFTRILQILKKSDIKYYYEKLPLIFDHFFEEILGLDNSSVTEFNFIQIQTLNELKRSECLFWENELEGGDYLINNFSLAVIFDSKKKPYTKIHGDYFIKTLTCNNPISLSKILEFLSLSIKPSKIKTSSKRNCLLNEMECLYIIICNIKPLNICSEVLSRIISMFGQFFILINKILLNKTFPPKIRDKYYSWLHKIFNFLRTSIGLQISSDKVDLYLPIFLLFLETFSLEDLNGDLFDCSIILKKCIAESVIQNLQSQLFSSSNECKNLANNIFIDNKKFYTIFDQFHFNTIQPHNLPSFNRAFSILKKLSKLIRPREYHVSNILLYYYLKKISIDLENQREDVIILLKSLFNLENFEMLNIFNNIYFFLSEVIFLELVTRIKKFCFKNFDINILIFGSNSIPLQSIINLLNISFISEFIFNSENNFKCLCWNLLKILYLFTLILFILSDSDFIYNYSNKFHDELIQKLDTSEEFYSQNLNHNFSRIIEEVCNLIKIILVKINIDTIFEESHNQLNSIPIDFITSNLYLNSFFNRLNIAFNSEKSYYFSYQLCLIYMNFILKCDHPGSSDNLLEIFHAILNSYSTKSFESYHEGQSKNKGFKLPITRVHLLINNETAKTFNDFILMNSHSILNNSKIQDVTDYKSSLNKQTDSLTKNLLLHILYSLLSFDELSSVCNNDKFNYLELEDFILDYEQIDNIFFQFFDSYKKSGYDNNDFITKNSLYDTKKLFSLQGNLNNNLEKLYIPPLKRRSNNLCNMVNILVSIIIKDFKFHKLVKYTIKLLIIASLNIKLFNGIINKQDYDSEYILSQRYRCSIHSNHILAKLISKSKSSSGTNTLSEIFDLSLLCGSLFSALNNIKIYNLKVKDENGFALCNSSLNLMSALLKRFSFKANGIESNIENISKTNNQCEMFNSDFKTTTESEKLHTLFNKVLEDVLSIVLNKQFDFKCVNSLISEINTSTRFSLKSIKRISGIFEPCIIDILLNSTHTQFQGMVLLLLTEISISWADCSYELAICIIKSIYSNSYFVRMYSSKLLGEIIFLTLNIPNLSSHPLNQISNASLDGILLEIFINNSNNQASKANSLLNLIFQSIKFSINNSENKYNLIHGIFNLGIVLLKKLKNQSCWNFFKTLDHSIYENLLVFIRDSFISFKHPLLRITALELMSLLFELEFPTNEKLKCLENLIYYWKNISSKSKTFYIDFSDPNNNLYLSISHPKNYFNENLSEHIYLIKIIVNNVFKNIDSRELSSLICLSPAFDKIIHPKILSEFYSSIIEILSISEKKDNFVKLSNLIDSNLKSIKHLISANKEQSINEKTEIRKLSIPTDLVKVLMRCLSFIGCNYKFSFVFLENEKSDSIIESIFDLIYQQELSDFKISKGKDEKSEEKTDIDLINSKIGRFFFQDQIQILEFSIFFIRFYKNIARNDSIPYVIVYELEKIVFDKILKMVCKNIFNGTQLTLEKKYLICKIIRTIFESLETELFLEIKVKKNDETKNLPCKKIGINDIHEGTILSLMYFNHNYWYNLMVCLIYLLTDEAAPIEKEAILTFNSFVNIIKYFCNNFLNQNEDSHCCCLNSYSEYENQIKQIVLLNDQNSCLFSIIVLDVISESLRSMETQNNSIFFPREIDNICNEYLNISQLATYQIFKYFKAISQKTLNSDEITEIKIYFEQWETQIKSQINLFERVYDCIKECPTQLIFIELFGSILIDELSILSFIISIRRLIIISKYREINNREDIFENSNLYISLFEKRLDFLLSNIHEKK
ncbi:Uncharacterized protein cmbei_3003010 [Cryptosporidium meleagridis]